jgi:hypothetical protein
VDIPNSDIVIPIAIVVACLLVVLLTWRVTRHRAKGWQLEDLDDAPRGDDMLIDIDAIDAWHRDFSQTVLVWIDSHEQTVATLGRSGLQLDLTEAAPGMNGTIETEMRDAITAHPTPAIRAQLSAMMVAAEATIVAVRRSDYPTAEKQHLTYIEYRDEWLRRLRETAPNDGAIGAAAAEADRPGADFVLRPVPDVEASADQAEAVAQAIAEPIADERSDPAEADPWQITRPRRSRRKRRRAG